jgi:hypothetical protein
MSAKENNGGHNRGHVMGLGEQHINKQILAEPGEGAWTRGFQHGNIVYLMHSNYRLACVCISHTGATVCTETRCSGRK